MPQVTDVTICNSALRKIHETPIVDLSESGPCDHFYPLIRDEMFARHDWSFATSRASLASTTESVIGNDNATLNVYNFPTDPFCFRVIEVLNSTASWFVEGRQILTSLSSPVDIRYIARTNEDVFPPWFVSALATRLAQELAVDSGASPQMMVLLDSQLHGDRGLWDQAVQQDIREKLVGQKGTDRRSKLWIDAR